MVITNLKTLAEWSIRPGARWIIIGSHLVLLSILFHRTGILDDKEALKYVGCAEDVLRGNLHDLTGNYLKYGAYVVFLLPFTAMGMPSAAVVFQILLGIWAGVCLHRLTRHLTGSMVLAQMAMALYLLCPLIQSWTLTLYTESFFTGLSIIVVERLIRNAGTGTGTTLLAGATLFARPIGLFIVGPAFIWKWTTAMFPSKRTGIRALACLGLLSISLLVPGIQKAQLRPIASGQVIAGVGGDTTGPDGPDGTNILSAHRHYLSHHSLVEWTVLGLRRMGSLFTLTRPYYSTFHNAMNALLYLLYPFILLGIRRAFNDPIASLVLAIPTMIVILVALTHDEWSGRFLVPLMPWMIILAMIGVPGTRMVRSGSSIAH